MCLTYLEVRRTLMPCPPRRRSMKNRDQVYNASVKGKARKQRYRSANREALLLYGRRYYRSKRLKELRAALACETHPVKRSEIRVQIAKLLMLIRQEADK